jgi:hypothetical protein
MHDIVPIAESISNTPASRNAFYHNLTVCVPLVLRSWQRGSICHNRVPFGQRALCYDSAGSNPLKDFFRAVQPPLLDGATAIYKWLTYRWSRINLPEEARVRKQYLRIP